MHNKPENASRLGVAMYAITHPKIFIDRHDLTRQSHRPRRLEEDDEDDKSNDAARITLPAKRSGLHMHGLAAYDGCISGPNCPSVSSTSFNWYALIMHEMEDGKGRRIMPAAWLVDEYSHIFSRTHILLF